MDTDTPHRNHTNTPHRNQINTPPNLNISPFQDSPVFNFINSLSPIKPVKPPPVTHTFNSFICASPQSIFTSPHLTSLKEFRLLTRHIHLDTLKPTHSAEQPLTDSASPHHNLNKFLENTDQRIFVGDAAIELPQPLKYNCGSPGYDSILCVDEANTVLNLPSEAAADVTYVQKERCKTNSVETNVLCQVTSQVEPKSDPQERVWDGLIPDPADLFIFNSPNEARAFNDLFQKPLDSSVDFMSLLQQSTNNSGQNVQFVHSIASGFENQIEELHSEPEAATEKDHPVSNVAMSSNPNEETNDELVSVMHRGLRRRCLDFEMATVRSKNPDDYSKTDSSTLQSGGRNVANEKQLIRTEQKSVSCNRILPGIGLHLNALAPLEDHNIIKNEKFSSGRQHTLLSSTSSLQITTSQEAHHLSLVAVSSKREFDSSNNDVQPGEDCSQASVSMAREDLISNSPKKKRHKADPAVETKGCKHCTCKKSKCLKLYCECFAAGVYCIEPCSCQGCFNQAIHEDTVLQTRKLIVSRNPLAFAPKVIRSSESVPDVGGDPNKTPASARHKRGCNCKKSSCLKKYCECYQGGVGCSISCRCEGCQNAFGTKDGSALVGACSEEETRAREKKVTKKVLQKTEIQNTEDHSDSALVKTPSRLSRALLQLPFSSKGKPPRSFATTISGSALFASGQKLGKPNSLCSQSKHAQTLPDDETPDALCTDNSPVACIKTSSPNGKRISSPKCDLGSSPSRRGGRKLILQPIPSFSSLSNQW